MVRTLQRMGVVLLLVAGGASPALACAGLIGPNGAVNLVRTTTLAAYHNGEEHYITAFSFQGGGGKFGSIIPLPGIPTRVERGGDWTLQRLIRETQVQFLARAAQAAPVTEDSARVILEKRIDALDITILQGGGAAVGRWAKDNGFTLPPDTPEVLDFYARRSQIFMAARFDADEAKRRGQQVGDGTPIHLTIPVKNPWVPLRILSLGKKAGDIVRADVYLLTNVRPALLPGARRGLDVRYNAAASPTLMRDLRTDKGMDWIPATGMWLTHLAINSNARDLTYDLAVDASGRGRPSREAAGLPWWEDPFFPLPDRPGSAPSDAPFMIAGVLGAAALIVRSRNRGMA
jgi:uncharacterized protein DUF2330